LALEILRQRFKQDRYRLLKALGVICDVPQDDAQEVVQFARLHGWRGPGSPESADKAKTLSALEYAADPGHLAAQWKVGRMYAAGDGVPKDDQRAFIYFSQIASTHPDEPPGTAQARIVTNAFVALGHYYLKGIPNTTVTPSIAPAATGNGASLSRELAQGGQRIGRPGRPLMR
jgi:hypothetical protein